MQVKALHIQKYIRLKCQISPQGICYGTTPACKLIQDISDFCNAIIKTKSYVCSAGGSNLAGYSTGINPTVANKTWARGYSKTLLNAVRNGRLGRAPS